MSDESKCLNAAAPEELGEALAWFRGTAVDTSGEYGPKIVRGTDVRAEIPVSREVWLCDDEDDGCPELSREAIGAAQAIVEAAKVLPQITKHIASLTGSLSQSQAECRRLRTILKNDSCRISSTGVPSDWTDAEIDAAIKEMSDDAE